MKWHFEKYKNKENGNEISSFDFYDLLVNGKLVLILDFSQMMQFHRANWKESKTFWSS